LKKYQ